VYQDLGRLFLFITLNGSDYRIDRIHGKMRVYLVPDNFKQQFGDLLFGLYLLFDLDTLDFADEESKNIN
jgi:hypothetical protein